MSAKAGVLTGTFDPVHLGHVALAEAATKKFNLALVLIWVNAQAGHKTGVTAYSDRLAMARIAARGHDELRVYEGYAALGSHVMKNFLKLEREYSGTKFTYLLGADTFATIDRWEDLQSVVEQATFGVAERPGAGSDDVTQVRARLGAPGKLLNAETFELAEHAQASSRRIRDAIREGRQPESLDPRVYEYIRAHNLYR